VPADSIVAVIVESAASSRSEIVALLIDPDVAIVIDGRSKT
jgi:hypothetical protein